ncbi:MAG TPA: LPS assembly lipoprotein LptE [Terriglobales bacterium]|nr:LPS assembly lipoprotein LptE [Terriglobales bacterium]
MRGFAVMLSFLVLGLSACGYKTGGHAATLPADVHTLAIPAFVNQSKTYRVEQVLTVAVVREFVSRTHYRILNQESGDADATLRGTVVSTQITPVAYDSTTGRAASAIIVVNMKVSLLDRHGKVLFENPNYSFHDQYQISHDITSFFEEESPAVDRLSQDFARTLVSNILEAF